MLGDDPPTRSVKNELSGRRPPNAAQQMLWTLVAVGRVRARGHLLKDHRQLARYGTYVDSLGMLFLAVHALCRNAVRANGAKIGFAPGFINSARRVFQDSDCGSSSPRCWRQTWLSKQRRKA